MNKGHYFYIELKHGEKICVKDSFTFIFGEEIGTGTITVQLDGEKLSLDRSGMLFSNSDSHIQNLSSSPITILKVSKNIFEENNSILSEAIKRNMSSLEIGNFTLSYEDKKILVSALSNLKEAPLYKMIDEHFELFQLFSIFIMLNNQIFKKSINENLMRKPLEREEKLVNDIVKLLERNIEKKVSLYELEKIFFTNRTHLNTLFNRYMNCSIGQYQMKLKMEKASFLLKDSTISTIDIGEKLGFYDTAHFSKTFKKIMGKTPTEYRTPMNEILTGTA